MSELIEAIQMLFVLYLFYITGIFTKSERRRFVRSCFTKRENIVETLLEENGTLTDYNVAVGGVDVEQLIRLILKSWLTYVLVWFFTEAVGMNLNAYAIFLIGVLMTAYQLTQRFLLQRNINLKEKLAR